MTVSSTNETLRIFSSYSWQELYTFDHSMQELTVNNTGELINIYREFNTVKEGSFYEALQRPFSLQRNNSK